MDNMQDLVCFLSDDDAWDLPLHIRYHELLQHMRVEENAIQPKGTGVEEEGLLQPHPDGHEQERRWWRWRRRWWFQRITSDQIEYQFKKLSWEESKSLLVRSTLVPYFTWFLCIAGIINYVYVNSRVCVPGASSSGGCNRRAPAPKPGK